MDAMRSAVFRAAGGAAALAVALADVRPARAFDLDPGFGGHAGAIFRGDEVGAREADFDTDHFMTVFSYFHSYHDRRAFERARSGFRGTFGSTSTADLYIDAAGKVEFTAWDLFVLRYRLIQDEDFDSRYLRNVVEGEILAGGGFYAGATAHLEADKEHVDVGGALGWRGEGGAEVRIDYVASDLFSRKSEDFDYEEPPRTVIARASAPVAPGAILGAWAEATPRFELDAHDVRDPFLFSMEKFRFGVRADLELGDAGAIGARLLFERARKNTVLTGPPDTRPDDDDPLATLRVERRALLGEILYARPMRGGRDELEVGLFGIYLREPSDFEDDERDLLFATRQVFAKARYAWLVPLDFLRESFHFAPAIYVGHVAFIERRPNAPGKTRRVHGVQAKANAQLEFRPTPAFRVVLNPTLRLDEPKFGGGNVQVVLTF